MLKRFVSLFLAAALLTAGFALAEEAAPAVPADVLAYVDGEPVPVDEAQVDFDVYVPQYEYYAQMYGWTDWEDTLRQSVAEHYVRVYLQKRECDRLGITPLSDEDQAELVAQADAMYESTLSNYADYFMTEDMTGEEAQAIVVEWLDEQGFTREYLRQTTIEEEILSRYCAYVTEDIAVTDEEVRAYYQEQVDAQKASYDAYPSLYAQEAQDGETAIYYAPEGVRSIFHILLLYSDEEQQAVTSLNAQIDAARQELASGEGDADALNERIAALESERDEALTDLYARAQGIYDRLEAGEDFFALMDEAGEDPGMQGEPYRTSGYLTWAGNGSFVEEFQDGAMALENPGDVSEPVLTSYGLHIILFDHEIESGAVPFDEVSDQISQALLKSRVDEAYDKAVDALYEAADIEYHLENIVYDASDDESEEQSWG